VALVLVVVTDVVDPLVQLPMSVHLVEVAVSVFVVVVPPWALEAVETLVVMEMPLLLGGLFWHPHTPFTVPQLAVPSLLLLLVEVQDWPPEPLDAYTHGSLELVLVGAGAAGSGGIGGTSTQVPDAQNPSGMFDPVGA
jgi:hypothetical protein